MLPMLHLCRTHYMPVAAFRVDREGDLLKRKSRVKKHFFFPSNCSPFICSPSHVSGLFFFFFLLLHPMEVALNADEIINDPTPGNHLWVISSATELLRVSFFFTCLARKLGWLLIPWLLSRLWGRATPVQVPELLDSLCYL